MIRSVYVAGPMTGIPEFNFPAFDSLTAELRANGYTVFNPHEHDQETCAGIDEAEATRTGDVSALVEEVGFDFQAAMAWDLARVLEADAICLLPGWHESTGARAERFVAETTGKTVMLAKPCALFGCDGHDCTGGWDWWPDAEQKRLTGPTCKSSAELHEEWRADYKAKMAANLASLPAIDTIAEDLGYTEALQAYRNRMSGEVRITDPTTGGSKGVKAARFDLIPQDILWELAVHFGKGEEKYPSPNDGTGRMNWQLGYDWSLSYGALQRHLSQFLQGEEFDEETGSHHLIAVAWHAFALRWFQGHGVGNDTRQKAAALCPING